MKNPAVRAPGFFHSMCSCLFDLRVSIMRQSNAGQFRPGTQSQKRREKSMAERDMQPGFMTNGDGRGAWEGSYGGQHDDASLGELLRRLSTDTGNLVSQEVALAKAELKDSVANVAKGAVKMGVAHTFALVGMMALTAFLIIGIGGVVGGHYAATALGVAIVELVVAAIAGKSAMASMKPQEIKPEATMATLREDKQWAQREMKDLKRDITSNPTTAHAGRQGK
jgi:uncharacterized membrane protein YqjE